MVNSNLSTFQEMEEEVTEMEQAIIIITKNNPLLHFSGSKTMQKCVE